MELEILACPVCGAGGKLNKTEDPAGNVFHCAYCDSRFTESSSLSEYEKVEDAVKSGLGSVVNEIMLSQKTEQYYNLRSVLWEKLHAKYIDSNAILGVCADIKKIAPHDFLAEFFEVANGTDDVQVAEYIQNIDVAENSLVIDLVFDFLIASLKEAYITPLALLLERAGDVFTPEKRQKYLTEFEKEAQKVQNGIYEASMERDVFLAYSGKDMKAVVETLNFLEENGLTCFAAFRNMQHGKDAVANYEKTLYEAIDNCKIFLFISSKNSRSYACDAFKKEIAYVKNQEMNKFPEYRNYEQIPDKYKKLRIEYRLDNAATPIVDKALKSFFSGLTYTENYDQLIARLVEYMEIANSPFVNNDDSVSASQKAPKSDVGEKRVEAEPKKQSFATYASNSSDSSYGDFSRNKGEAKSLYHKGCAYEGGFGVTADPHTALKYFLDAAKMGNVDAQYKLFTYYSNGVGVTQDMSAAIQWAEQAASQGHNEASYQVGLYYYNSGIFDKAARYLEGPANSGYAEAQFRMGYCYHMGSGVTVNYNKAVDYYKSAIAKGHVLAKNNLAVCYENGFGVSKNLVVAFKLYKEAGEKGEPLAQVACAACYERGIGTQISYADALIWYRKAAAQGNQSAIESVARLEREHIEAKHTAYAKTESGKAPFFSLDDKLSPNDEKCRTKLIFICLFLGCLGVHNFMMGEKKKGIVKIVATYFYGIGIILNIIDLVKIIKRTYTVDPNAFF